MSVFSFDIENLFCFPRNIHYLILVFKFSRTNPFLTLSKHRKENLYLWLHSYWIFSMTNFLIHLIIILVSPSVSFGFLIFLCFFFLKEVEEGQLMYQNKKYMCICMYVYIHTQIVCLFVSPTIYTHIYSQMFVNVYVPVYIPLTTTHKFYMW